ncbi:MAG: XTP/dITP diphosphohydrolase [Francisella sp.]|jgi:XTP/dITP diphosphohydrolase
MKQIILASSNKGKIKEFKEIFRKIGIEIIPQTEFDIPDADEIGLTFIENAILKARNCSVHTGLPAIADDSGLEVLSLNGEPGIYSARYAGQHGDDRANINKLLSNLVNSDQRQARFICALAFLRHGNDPTPILATGELNGEITTKEHGEDGFGYDRIFFVPHLNKTLAQVSSDTKNQISHRATALSKLIGQFSTKI